MWAALENLNFYTFKIQKKIWKERRWLLVMFLFFIINSILLPRPLNLIIPYACLVISLFSKNNIKWLLFFLFLSEFPGGFFYQIDQSFILFSQYNISLFGIYSFCIISIYLFKGKLRIVNSRYKIIIILFITYFVSLLLYSITSGIDIVKILDILFHFAPFLWIIALENIFKSYYDFKKFVLLSNTLVYIHIISQVFVIITGVELVSVFTNFPGRDLGDRIAYGSLLMFTTIIGNLIIYNIDKERPVVYLSNVMLFSLSFFLTATRGYIIAVGFIVLITLMYKFKFSLSKMVFPSILLIALIFILNLNESIINSYDRLSTLEAFYEGDLTAEATLARITERGPKVMEQFKKSPIFGFAFTDAYYKYSDGHVGNQNLLLNGGILGFFIVMLLLIRYIYILQIHKNRYNNLPLTILQLSMIGYFIIHSTSSQIFSFSPGSSFIRIAFIFIWAEIFINPNFALDKNTAPVNALKRII